MKIKYTICLLTIFFFSIGLSGNLNAETAEKVMMGIDSLFNGNYSDLLKKKRIGILTNQTAVDKNMQWTVDIFKANRSKYGYTITALFSPEHGIQGASYASENVQNGKDSQGIPIYSLHSETRRPTPEMLQGIDLLIFDIQDVGSRSYTYVSTLFYVMEEAAKLRIPVVVLDRPNPINGVTVDGTMLEEKWKSFVGYINVPYCHGMTVGELAHYFNEQEKVGCDLRVIPMQGWKRWMSFTDTGLHWIPTSPNVPEPETPLFYATTGYLGELQIVNIGIGYTLPFRLVGAPWIDAEKFAAALNRQKFLGVAFTPFHFRPFYGKFAHEDCQGVLIHITDKSLYKPVSTQFLLIGMLKSLYPEQFSQALQMAKTRKEMFCKVTGTEELYRIISEEKNIVWKLRAVHQKQREAFLAIRKKYLIPSYSSN